MPTMPKYNIQFHDAAYELLGVLSELTQEPRADVIRDALSVYWWIATEIMAGSQVLVQRGSTITEVQLAAPLGALPPKNADEIDALKRRIWIAGELGAEDQPDPGQST
jgi:hypothetical protein